MLPFVRLFAILAALGLVALVQAAGALTSLDRSLIDARYAWNSHPPTGEVVLAEIDSASLAEFGVWPWPRSIHARTLDALLAMGAREVVFDIDFSTASTLREDAVLAAALERAGGYAWLAAFEQHSGVTGRTTATLPLPLFAAHADAIAVNVERNGQGLPGVVPQVLVAGDRIVPSLAAALGRPKVPLPEKLPIDFSNDLNGVDRFNIAGLLAGSVEADRVADKVVVIGATALELRDQFEVPRFVMVSGPLLQVAALDTVLGGRIIRDLGLLPSLIGALLVAAIGGMLLDRFKPRWRVGLALGLMLSFEAVATIAYGQLGLLYPTALFHVAMVAFIGLGLIDELARQWQQRLRAQKRLSFLARHDAVTGALSRGGMIEALEAWRADQRSFSVLAIGLQRLALLRGALGQEIAERALRAIYLMLLARYPGHRIGLVAQDVFGLATPTPLSPERAETLRAEIADLLAGGFSVDEHRVLVDAHFGLAHTAECSVEDVLRHAELALSDANAATGLALVVFEPQMQQRIVAQRQLDTDLREAIARDEFHVVFQPQVALADGRLVGVEALVRWQHPTLGMVSPALFVPLAEETGFIIELGAFVLEEACRQATTWPWEGRLAVNVSPTQLALTDLSATIADVLDRTGFPAGRLDIEVTESMLLSNPARVSKTLTGLRDLGTGIAIDDFGTGYSSLSYLADLPFDKLKIDQSFVRRLDAGRANLAILNSVIGLAHRLGKLVVAEGIETEAQRDTLRTMACDIGQGYLFGRPAQGSSLLERITTGNPRKQAS